MKIIIIGAGFTGTQLAKLLVNGKNDVVLIENNEELARHVSSRIDCEVITANGNNLSVLEDAGIATADALICVTSSDEVNMITCSLVDSVYPDVLKIARVRNYSYYSETADASKKHAETIKEKHRPLYGIDFIVHPDIVARRQSSIPWKKAPSRTPPSSRTPPTSLSASKSRQTADLTVSPSKTSEKRRTKNSCSHSSKKTANQHSPAEKRFFMRAIRWE
ncbi:MAG: NAD-binding protein [Bacteroidales bacterium]|nr:NAD-binding protein [Bacteroidales bacterium]